MQVKNTLDIARHIPHCEIRFRNVTQTFTQNVHQTLLVSVKNTYLKPVSVIVLILCNIRYSMSISTGASTERSRCRAVVTY